MRILQIIKSKLKTKPKTKIMKSQIEKVLDAYDYLGYARHADAIDQNKIPKKHGNKHA